MNNGSSFWDRYTKARISRRRALQAAAVGGASVGAIALVGCSSDNNNNNNNGGQTPSGGASPTAGTEQPVTGGTFNGTVSLVLGKDPHKAATFLTHALASYSYSRLMRFKTQRGELPQSDWYQPVNELASKVEHPDDTTYIFTLNDVNWHNVPPVNGRKLTADDVVFSFNRYSEISPNKANLDMVDSVTASSDGTQVTFKLKQPFGLFLNRIASFQDLWIMPKEFVEESENAAEERMLGSGPFIFDSYEANVAMKWKKNPDYFETDENGNKLPYVDAVNLAIITDQNQVLSQFAAKQLDTITVPPKLLSTVRSQSPDAVIDSSLSQILSFLYFEPASYTSDKLPFKDERVRRGMSMAIDREGLLNLVSPEGGKWANLINAGFGDAWWLDPQGSEIGDAGKWYQYDPQEARAQFEAAGVSEFNTPMHFSTTVYTTIVPYYDIVRQALPAMLKDAGVSVQEVGEEYGVYISKTFGRGEFDGFTFGLESVFSDVAAYWTNMFYPRDAGGGRNHSSVNDAELVNRIESMLAIQDIEELQNENKDLQKYVSDKMYYVPVVSPYQFGARQPNIKGVVNTTGPTTYAVGTEGTMWLWKEA